MRIDLATGFGFLALVSAGLAPVAGAFSVFSAVS